MVRLEGILAEISHADLDARIAALPNLVNDDAWLVHRGRFLSVDFVIELGRRPFHVSIEHGRIVGLDRGSVPMRPWRFAIRGDDEGWRQFWKKMPPPHCHDILALTRHGGFRIEGDLHPFMANLLYFKDALAAPRCLATDQ